MKKILFLTILLLLAGSAFAGDWANHDRGGPIEKIYAADTYITVKLNSVSIPPANGTCPTNNFVSFTADMGSPAYKKILSMLMLAKTTGVGIGWTHGGCSPDNGQYQALGTEIFIE